MEENSNMHCVRKVCEDLYWVGGNDHRLALFENIFPLPKGVSYNSYLLMDEKTVLFDTVDWDVCRQMLENIRHVLQDRPLDYLVVNHMEPDHCEGIEELLLRYPDLQVISTEKSFLLMRQFNYPIDGRTIEVKEGDTMRFGRHTIAFVQAPMLHWPEVMVSYDTTNGMLFSADAFGSFGALDGKLFNDEVDFDRDWLDEARRYYTNIVGKYGAHVQAIMAKAAGLDIRYICPLHGPVWRSDFDYLFDKYQRWSTYTPETDGVVIVYASMYGNTESVAQTLAAKLTEKGVRHVAVRDVSNTHFSDLIADVFRYSHIIFASVTYNLGIYPLMHNLLIDMKALNVQKRICGIIENGSWAPKAGSLIHTFLDEEMKQMSILNTELTVVSSLRPDKEGELDALAEGIVDTMGKGADA